MSEPSVSEPSVRLVSMRAAASLLGDAGLSWQAARAVLLCGLAGPGERAGGALLYDRVEVEAGRLQLSTGDQDNRDQDNGDQDMWDQLRHGWVADAITRLRLKLAVEEQGYFPFVATAGGYVVLGANVVGVEVAGSEVAGSEVAGSGSAVLAESTNSTSLTLAAPGEWWDRYAGHRLATGRGHHWTFWPRVDPGARLTTPTTEPPRAIPARRRTHEQGMRVDPTSLQQ